MAGSFFSFITAGGRFNYVDDSDCGGVKYTFQVTSDFDNGDGGGVRSDGGSRGWDDLMTVKVPISRLVVNMKGAVEVWSWRSK